MLLLTDRFSSFIILLTEEKEWWGNALLIKFVASIVPSIWRILNYKYSPFSFLILFLLYAGIFQLGELWVK